MNLNQMMQQAQKAQKELQKKLEDFESKEFEFNYKNGSIIVRINGACKITDLKINKTLIDPEDPVMLQEMICEAANSAIESILDDREEIQSSVMNR
jgi:DNA-binding YbaB/EbfC family protein